MIVFNKKDLIIKSNQVIEASYQLSATEQRIVLAAISKIGRDAKVTDEEIYRVTVEDIKKLGIHEKTAYRDLKEGVNRLYDRSINLAIDEESIKMRWVQSIRFLESRGVIGIRFTKEILPFISNLSREFTKYFLSDISGMNSAYAIRFYELLSQYRSIGKREIAVDDIRKMLELGKRYPLFADLKRWVIDTAIDQINQHSPIHVTYEQKKTGRKITHILFSFKQKEIKELDQSKSTFLKMSDAQINMFGNQLAQLPDLAYLAVGNESYEALASRIKDMLRDQSKQKQFTPYLEQVGFKTSKS
ncbi:replication initiation protein RepM (plasmid) [Acinetobacter sp. ESL0695]|uniref:replication initiation protein RepM n=1 Tax=Acinetobacter sp. ESL0695 TaxID=2983215 RepID=UPI0023F1BCF5|nr:replication initiation protein RepM [Acinetobacter sp. ESL0695]WEV50269.1 replication initiation protein RepM [Acinetobacter sp. ESL0695]